MVTAHQVGKELEEERHNEQAYVPAVHIGIGGYYYIVVAQPVQPFFYIQRMLQQVEFFILIHYLFGQAIAVEWLTPQAEYCLAFHRPALGYRTTCRVALGNEDG